MDTDTEQPVDSDDGKEYEDLRETVNNIADFMKVNDFQGVLSKMKDLQTHTNIISEERDGIRPRFYIRSMVELEDCITELYNDRKRIPKRKRECFQTVKSRFSKIAKTVAADMAEHRKNLSADNGEESESDADDEYEAESETESSDGNEERTDNDSSNMKVVLPYNENALGFGRRILRIGSTKLTFEEAYSHPEYVKMALDVSNLTKHRIPIGFTQFVLKKMAVSAITCNTFANALNPKAKEFLLNLIPQDADVKQVHQRNPHQRPSVFRSRFSKLFTTKVIKNLRNENCEMEYVEQLARVFPFEIDKNVPQYKNDILDEFDDGFYKRMDTFLKQHFDEPPAAREITGLFINNVRHFFKTTSEKKFAIPRLNDKGIAHFKLLETEYRSVLEHFFNWRRHVPVLQRDNKDFQTLPEKNFKELASLLETKVFRKNPVGYNDVFKKYIFFFIHALPEEDPTSVFFIDDMIYQCLLSLHRFRTSREDVTLAFDVAMISLMTLLGQKLESKSSKIDWHSMNSLTLRDMKHYITTFVSNKNTRPNVQFNFEYANGLLCEIPFRVKNNIYFDVVYATKEYNSQKGIMYFVSKLICSAFSPPGNPITEIIEYNPYKGEEMRFSISTDMIENVKNFVRLSNRKNITEVWPKSRRHQYLYSLRGRLISSSVLVSRR